MAVVAVPFPPATSAVARFNAFKFFMEGTGSEVPQNVVSGNYLTYTSDATLNAMDMASERVQREAPNAPQAIKNEAALRYFGYMYTSGSFGTIRSEVTRYLEINTTFVTNHQRAFINCGAKAMLAPWKPLGAATVRHSTEADQ